MNPLALAQLLAQLIPLGLQVYNEIQQANPGQLAPLATILAAADADWDQVAKLAAQQLADAQAQPPAAGGTTQP